MVRRSKVKENHPRDTDSSWLEDPKTLGMVKSQVEDVDLVRLRREQFVRSAIVVFCRNGYHSSTVKEIAQEAGVSAGLIYQYVSDKEDVLFLALQLICYTLKKGLPEAFKSTSDPVSRYCACFEAYCRVIDANRDASILTYRETKSLTREHRGLIKSMELETNEVVASAVRDCISKGYFHEIDVELFVYHTIMTAHAWSLKYWRLSRITTINKYIETNKKFLLTSVLTEKGREAFEKLAICGVD
ncbi:TetR/AcrR family transcriptional regulator [Sinorhizobium medicae]|uniref:TetR/AcrR family transcriptional regulator n=1 Tax=Sinorhizobium medicae TaxID=110321 RepID=UPI000FDB2A70|nr:TetR/AcrR family transcriptional regulator [Sinorhizobium medicae]RVO73502.1 TetR/AcrR family transcriptional regulator [Sinorhizobium medicae]